VSGKRLICPSVREWKEKWAHPVNIAHKREEKKTTSTCCSDLGKKRAVLSLSGVQAGARKEEEGWGARSSFAVAAQALEHLGKRGGTRPHET